MIPRRVSGYNFDELLEGTKFNVARALVGSEGTCVSVVGATLNLTASPPHRVLVVLAFPDAFLAADAVMAILKHKPIGLEGFDGLLVSCMKKKRLALENVALLPEGGGFLLVEMGAWDAAEAQAKAEALDREAQRLAGRAFGADLLAERGGADLGGAGFGAGGDGVCARRAERV